MALRLRRVFRVIRQGGARQDEEGLAGLHECLRALIEQRGIVFLNPGAARGALKQEVAAIGAVTDGEVAIPQAQTIRRGGGGASNEAVAGCEAERARAVRDGEA